MTETPLEKIALAAWLIWGCGPFLVIDAAPWLWRHARQWAR